MRRAVSLATLVAIASVAANTSALATRPAKFTWDKNGMLLGEFSFDDAIDNTSQRKRLAGGFPVTIVMRGYVLPNAGGDPIALTAHTCKIAYDLWQEVYFVVVNNGKKSPPIANLNGVYKRCTRMTALPIADKGVFKGKAPDHYLAVKVEVNPKSEQLLSQIQGWVTRPVVAGSISPTDALFTTFVGLFMKSTASTADIVIDFRTASFPAP